MQDTSKSLGSKAKSHKATSDAAQEVMEKSVGGMDSASHASKAVASDTPNDGQPNDGQPVTSSTSRKSASTDLFRGKQSGGQTSTMAQDSGAASRRLNVGQSAADETRFGGTRPVDNVMQAGSVQGVGIEGAHAVAKARESAGDDHVPLNADEQDDMLIVQALEKMMQESQQEEAAQEQESVNSFTPVGMGEDLKKLMLEVQEHQIAAEKAKDPPKGDENDDVGKEAWDEPGTWVDAPEAQREPEDVDEAPSPPVALTEEQKRERLVLETAADLFLSGDPTALQQLQDIDQVWGLCCLGA